MRSLLLATCILLGCAPQGSAYEFIGIFGDPNGGACAVTAPVGGPPSTLYILALIDGSLPVPGIQGAEFSVTGLPAGQYTTVSVANPASNLLRGDPFQGGCQIAFSSCQLGPWVLLYTVTLTNVSDAIGSLILRVNAHATPSNPNFPCPLVVSCTPPVFSLRCVGGGPIYLNYPNQTVPPHAPEPADAAVEVSVHPLLSWAWSVPPRCDPGAPQEVLFFGTDPDPPFLTATLSSCPPRTCFEAGPLVGNTTYYWRAINSDTGTGPVWRFTTGTLAAESMSWGRLKTLFH